MQIEAKSIRALITSLRNKGYIVYDKPYQLNIVGVRKDSTVPNKFDDLIYVFFKNDKGDWEGKYFTATTDPGTYYLKNPLSTLGTAILKEGQWVDTYIIGKHKGQYEALVQNKPLTVIRDYDRNAILDFNNGREETGLFGINIHKAGKDSKDVDTWSAGCQVFQKSDDFETFMKLARKHRDLYGNKFTYTLIDERAYNRAMRRRLSYVIGIGLIIGALYVGYNAYKKK
jgi:hypothetical protein